MPDWRWASLFFIGTLLGLLIWDAPITIHWSLEPIYISSKSSVLETIKPLFVPSMRMSYFRPVLFTAINLLWNLSCGDYHSLRLIKSLALGAFGVAIYFFYLRFEPRKWVAYLSSLLCMLSPPVLISTYVETDFEILGSALLFFSLCALFGSNGRWKAIVFIILSAVAILTHESIRVTLLIMIFSYFISAHAKLLLQMRELNTFLLKHRQKAAAVLLVVSLILVSTFLVSFGKPYPPRLGRELTLRYIHFQLTHNIVQLFYAFFTFGSFILALSLMRGKSAIPTALFLLPLIFITPPIVSFSFYGMILFSSGLPTITIFSFVLVGALVAKCVREKFTIRFYSMSILLFLLTMILGLLFIPFGRDDISSRAYVVVLPLLAYVTVDAFFSILERGRKSKILLGAALISALSVCYYVGASAFNIYSETMSHSQIEYEMKDHLTGINLSNATLLYTDYFIFPVHRVDLLLLGGSEMNLSSAKFEWLNVSEDPAGLKAKVCEKVGAGSVYVYMIRSKADVDSSLYPVLQGDFRWTENTIVMLLPEYGLIRIAHKDTYTNSTVVEEVLSGADKIYECRTTYIQVQPWIDDAISRWIMRIPYLIQYEYRGVLYRVTPGEIRCQSGSAA